VLLLLLLVQQASKQTNTISVSGLFAY